MPARTKQALTDDDFSKIKLLVSEELKPVHELALRHEQTLFGAMGDNGLNGDMKKVKSVLDEFNALKNKAFGILIVVQLLIGALSYWVPKWIEHTPK